MLGGIGGRIISGGADSQTSPIFGGGGGIGGLNCEPRLTPTGSGLIPAGILPGIFMGGRI